MTKLSDLPNELVATIIKRVNPHDMYACSLVNRQFHVLVNPLLWQVINVDTSARFNKLMAGLKAAAVSASAADTTSSCTPLGALIRHVHLDSFLTNAQFLRFMEHASHMEELIMEEAESITDRSAKHLGRHCPNLKSLTLCRSNITQVSIQALGEHCHQLTKLALLSCPGFTTNAFHSLARCPLANVITYACGMDDTNNYNNKYFGRRTMNQAVLDLVGFQHITSLALLHCPPAFAERLIATLVSTTPLLWPQLTKLSLTGSDTVTNRQAIAFVRSRPRLTVLAFEPNSLYDTFLEAVATYLPDIESLGLSGSDHITAQGVRKLIKRCDMLEQVRLYGCKMTIDDFPEAGFDCLDLEVKNRKTVALLDIHAIVEIQTMGTSSDEDDSSDNDDDFH